MTELIVICDKLHINYHLSSINYHLLSVIYRLSAVQKSFDVFEYTFSDIASIFFHEFLTGDVFEQFDVAVTCLLYTSDAADDLLCVALGGCRILQKKKKKI